MLPAYLPFLARPEELVIESLDWRMRGVVQAINRSGWCWTTESCAGHSDKADPYDRPLLRLVAKHDRLPDVVTAILNACREAMPEQYVAAELIEDFVDDEYAGIRVRLCTEPGDVRAFTALSRILSQ